MNPSKRQIRYFDLAKRVARKSNHHRYHIGCVIVKSNKILSFGFNQLKSHPKSPNKYKALHAEVHAVIGVSIHELKNADVYVYRENTLGIALAKPCPTCMKMLLDLDVKNIYYTNNGGYDAIY